MKTTAVEWAARVKAWGESGQLAADFVSGKEFSDKMLVWWRGELARRARRKAGVRMARVVRRSIEPMTIAIGSARIEVRQGFDRELLREVIAALGGAP